MPKIKVNEKALAHLSRGLYRSPASALRELVSNSWDANATTVRIDTNYPNFYQLVVEDNGDGFTKEEFQSLMEGGIGNSTKRPLEKDLINDRPLIGRLGIGLLGIAQMCGSFSITSNTKDGKGFSASVYLYDLLKGKLDTNNEEVVIPTGEIDVGTYDFIDNFIPDRKKSGTIIITKDIHPTFIRSFQNSLKYEKFKDPPLEWSETRKIFSSHNIRSIQELGDYWRLIWELSVSCPLPYLDKKALPNSLISEEQEKLVKYNFQVFLDGIKLCKPVYLENNPSGYTYYKIDNENFKVYGKNLSFHGYIIVQEGAQLRPDELRGVLLRVKNIGIGYYDQTMLDYRINEGPRSRWLTSEIIVDEGLEDAINIDRDSFNKFHPEYRKIQEYVHEQLQNNIFPKVYKQIDVRTIQRQQLKTKERDLHLSKIFKEHIEVPVEIKPKSHDDNLTSSKVVTKNKRKSIEIDVPKENEIKVKKTHQKLAASILAIFEIALREQTIEEQRKTFTDLLTDLLSKW